MGRDMSKKKSKLTVEFASPKDLEDFLTAHQYLSQVAVRQGQVFTSAARFGAICIVKEINVLGARLREALDEKMEAAEDNDTDNVNEESKDVSDK